MYTLSVRECVHSTRECIYSISEAHGLRVHCYSHSWRLTSNSHEFNGSFVFRKKKRNIQVWTHVDASDFRRHLDSMVRVRMYAHVQVCLCPWQCASQLLLLLYVSMCICTCEVCFVTACWHVCSYVRMYCMKKQHSNVMHLVDSDFYFGVPQGHRICVWDGTFQPYR